MDSDVGVGIGHNKAVVSSIDGAGMPSAPNRAGNLVDFDGPNDPEDPYCWNVWYKWSMVVLISMPSLVVNLAILMVAPAYSRILDEFKSTNKLHSTLLVSIWELGEVVGPLIIAPLTEIHGRLPVYHVANILFIIFSIGAALSTSMSMLIAMRFFLGLSVGSTVINPCIVGDIFREQERGRAMGVMGMVPVIAPVFGPIFGGLITSARGWRWTFWLTVLIASPLQVLFMIFFRETYKIKILQKKARRMRHHTGNDLLWSRYDLHVDASTLLQASVLRPLKLLVTSPVVIAVGVCSAFGMSMVYVIVTSLNVIYNERYQFSQSLIGVTYLGMGIGMVLSVFLCGHFIDWYLEKDNSWLVRGRSEHRLPPMLLGSILVPLATVAYGWAVQGHLHWIVPILFTSLVGFGYITIAVPAWSYLVDVFGVYSASATAANVVLRNAVAAALPLAGPPLVDRLGFGWGYLVLAVAGLIIASPIAVLLMIRGHSMRQSNQFRKRLHEDERQQR